jgi:hypothetical protein
VKTTGQTCTLCGNTAASVTQDGHAHDVDCPRCGQFCFRGFHRGIGADVGDKMHLLSGLARNTWEATEERFVFTMGVLSSWPDVLKAASVPVPSDTDVQGKADAILRHLRRKSEFPGAVVRLTGNKDMSVGFCRNIEELRFCLACLVQRELVTNPGIVGVLSWDYQITPSGWTYLTGVTARTEDQGFVAMSFKAELKPVWSEGLFHGIENAGYKALRIDKKDHNNRIDDEIVAEIRKSRFVTADLTGRNAGAYFEAGFAMGLGKPVIWTCQQEEIDAGKVHFDTRQYSIVPWTENEWPDFAKRLTQRIEATIGRGRYKPA